MSADPARVATARQVLAHLGVTVADLQAEPGPGAADGRRVPAPGCRRGRAGRPPHLRHLLGPDGRAWGDRPLDAIAASDIEALQRQTAATARSRRNSRNGRHAGEHVIAAARAIYNRAIADGLIDAAASPAHRVAKPRRLPSTRRALTADELDEINLAARTSGNDVILDALLLRLHTETACRRGGALGAAAGRPRHRPAASSG